ncbi:hypothetical protein E8E12_001843 [Didymella heteroderae]|uniref:Uncharacterized protein n=1 Tax=Didymella heteroderae TaxID=1769908 RepID=A0A9P4WWR6_9PLEO|nr:hypothetical protein E8E12_001843 [Didymella heteroderae]
MRADKRITWEHADRPVLCAVKHDGIDVETLASKQRANRTLDRALDITGVCTEGVRISPHETRYGAATDLMMPKSEHATHTKEEVSEFIAHGHQSRETTVKYTRRYTAEETRVKLTAEDDKFSELVAQTDPNWKYLQRLKDTEGHTLLDKE